jgi:hypothetical protein
LKELKLIDNYSKKSTIDPYTISIFREVGMKVAYFLIIFILVVATYESCGGIMFEYYSNSGQDYITSFNVPIKNIVDKKDALEKTKLACENFMAAENYGNIDLELDLASQRYAELMRLQKQELSNQVNQSTDQYNKFWSRIDKFLDRRGKMKY